MIYMRASFWNFGNFGISILDIKIKIRISFKSFVSKKARTWRLKKTHKITIVKKTYTFVKNNVFQYSHRIKNIFGSNLCQ